MRGARWDQRRYQQPVVAPRMDDPRVVVQARRVPASSPDAHGHASNTLTTSSGLQFEEPSREELLARKRRSRRLLLTTKTLENAIAAPAISGLR